MISATIQFDVPTITPADLAAREAISLAEHRARLAEVARLAKECGRQARHGRGHRGGRGHGRAVRCVELKREFASCRAAAKFVFEMRGKCQRASAVSKAAELGRRCGGLRWEFIGE
jgi:hypothetical protein